VSELTALFWRHALLEARERLRRNGAELPAVLPDASPYLGIDRDRLACPRAPASLVERRAIWSFGVGCVHG
jgi:hypothetical protein